MRLGGELLRTQLAVWLLLVLGAGLLMPATGRAQCTPLDQNSGEHCTAPTPTPWIYYTHYNFNGGPNLGNFSSMDEVIQAIIADRMAVVDPMPCSFTVSSINYDSGPIPKAFPGAPDTDIGHEHTLNMTDIWSSGAPCNVTSYGQIVVYMTRTFVCPAGYLMMYQYGPPRVGPYCQLSYWKPDERKSAGCPQCPERGQVGKGNPIEIGSGNKYQRESDYVGAGHHPLRVQRHYNSLLVKNYGQTQYYS